MSVSLYDKALYDKINAWVKDKRARVLAPDESLRLFQISADENKDKPVTLPLIALSRASNIEISYTHKRPLTFDGMMLDHAHVPEGLTEKEKEEWFNKLWDDGKAKSIQLNAIPMVLNYQLDIYAKERKTIDEYVRNFVFNLVNNPKVTFVLPYNSVEYKHDSNVKVLSPIQDNSDIPSRLFSGQFYRYTIGLIIDDAYLFSAPIENTLSFGDYEVEIGNDGEFEN